MNNNLELKNKIEEVIKTTFQSMRVISNIDIDTDETALSVTRDGKFRLKYPIKQVKDNKNKEKEDNKKKIIRISEQELKQVFIYNLQKYTRYWFSVETPTVNKYLFKNMGIPEKNDNNQSGSVDLSIYESETSQIPCAHIEFKCGNPEPLAFQKDILKLYQEDIEMGFFVQIIQSEGKNTWESLYDKFFGEKEFIKKIRELNNHKVYVYILSLKTGNCFIINKDLKAIPFDGKSTFTPKPLSECK